jgi:hypothetical protein
VRADLKFAMRQLRRGPVSIAAAFAALVLANAAAGRAQQAGQAAPLPTAQQVMARFVAAQGGHDAIFRHGAMTVRGKLQIPARNIDYDQVSYYKDGKAVTEVSYPDGGVDRSGFDGSVGWEVDPKSSPVVAPAKLVESIRRDADMHYFGHVLDYFQSMDVVEITSFAGHTCFHLKGVNKWGIRNEHFYDTTSGLLMGYKFDSSWQGGPGQEVEVFSGYRDFDGWLMPTSDVVTDATGTTNSITTSVSFDDIPDSKFALPEPIVALLAKKPAK